MIGALAAWRMEARHDTRDELRLFHELSFEDGLKGDYFLVKDSKTWEGATYQYGAMAKDFTN